MRRSLVVVGGFAVALVSPIEAHHSPVAFEMSQVVAFDGVITSFDWRNPHVYLAVEARNGLEWLIETDATPVMRRSGWTKLRPGSSGTLPIGVKSRAKKGFAKT